MALFPLFLHCIVSLDPPVNTYFLVLPDGTRQQLTEDDIKDFMKEIDPNNQGTIGAKDFIKFYQS